MTQTKTSQLFDQNASVGKLFFLAVMAIALSALVPMNLFAPVPLAIAFLLYGRLATFAVGGISVGFLWAVSTMTKTFTGYTVGLYLVAFLYAILVAEVIYRNVSPVKGLLVTGFALVVLNGSLLIGFEQMNPTVLKSEITKSVTSFLTVLKKQKNEPSGVASGEEERAFDEFVSKPEALANDIYSSLPYYVFAFSFLSLWLSLYVTLRNTIVWRYKVVYGYGLSDLNHFKVPEFFVYPLILSLVLWLGTDYGLPKETEVIGRNLLYSLGVLYLIQGFGVYSDFLKFLKIGGFIKTLFLAFTFMLATNFLAVLGIFDLWFNFRRFFTNLKKDEGDTI